MIKAGRRAFNVLITFTFSLIDFDPPRFLKFIKENVNVVETRAPHPNTNVCAIANFAKEFYQLDRLKIILKY